MNEDEDIHHTVITVTAKDKDECTTRWTLSVKPSHWVTLLFFVQLPRFVTKSPAVTMVVLLLWRTRRGPSTWPVRLITRPAKRFVLPAILLDLSFLPSFLSFLVFPWFALQFASCCSCLLSVARVSGSLSKRMSPSFLFLPPAVVCICLIHTTVPITPGRVG